MNPVSEERQSFALHEVCERISVGLATSVTQHYRPAGVPIVRNQNIKEGYFDESDMLYVSNQFADANSSKAAKGFDVLTVRTGANLGDTCVLPQEFDNCQTFTTLITTPRRTVLDPQFLCLHMNSLIGKRELARLQVGGGKGNLNTGHLRHYRIDLPPLPEQKVIAAALRDVDALLGALGRLIAKKRDLKQAAMQQLLTGQARLPRFSAKWETKRLADIGRFIKGRGIKKEEARSGELPCVRYGEIYTHHNDVVRRFNSWISREVAATAIRLHAGDVLFAGSGETKEEIGKAVVFVDQVEAYAGGDIVILRSTGCDPVFLGYLLNTAPVVAQKASYGQGDAVVHISASSLGRVQVKLPESAEQTAIATILTDIDSELAALEQLRDKTRLIRQGMMQELLIGRTHLV